MADYFTVDLTAMGQLTTALQQATQLMETALDNMRDIGGRSFGSPFLDWAADNFQHTWRYGLKQLKGRTGETHDKLEATYDDYHDIETALTDFFRALATDIAEG